MSAPRLRQLSGLAAFAREHGFDAAVFGDAVTIWIPWTNVTAGTEGTDEFVVRTLAETRDALGY